MPDREQNWFTYVAVVIFLEDKDLLGSISFSIKKIAGREVRGGGTYV